MERARADGSDTRRLPHWADLLITFALSVAFFGLTYSLVIGFFRVPTGSMLETIHLDDRVLGERITYRFHGPQSGDIVTFVDPTEPTENLIKRVIATEGQVVDIRGGVVYVDGEALDEPYTQGKRTDQLVAHGPNLTGGIAYPHTVADGCLWLMGDNRTDSLDSRFFGDVPTQSVISRAVLIYWPPEHIGAL